MMVWAVKMKCLLLLLVGAGLLVLPDRATAQGRRWHDPYKQGLQAIEQSQWAEAVTKLQLALDRSPDCQANKRVEGVFSADYCPRLFLGEALAGLGQIEQAEAQLRSVEPGLPKQFLSQFARVKRVVTAARLTAFAEADIAEVRSFVDAGEHRKALEQLGRLLQRHQQPGIRSRLSTLETEAKHRLASQLVAESSDLVSSGHLQSASAKVEEALTLQPELAAAVEATANLRQRSALFARLVEESKTATASGDFASALSALRKARDVDIEAFQAARFGSAMLAVARRKRDSGTPQRPPETSVLVLSCDQDCVVRVDEGTELRLSRGRPSLIAVRGGTHRILARNTQSDTWSSSVSLADGQLVDVAVPLARLAGRRAAQDTERSQLLAEIANLRLRIANAHSEQQRARAAALAYGQQSNALQSRIDELIRQIGSLESKFADETAQAEADEKYARDAATQSIAASGTLRSVLEAARSGVVAVKRSAAQSHRKRAQQLLAEISDMTRELYRLTSQ